MCTFLPSMYILYQLYRAESMFIILKNILVCVISAGLQAHNLFEKKYI